MACLHHANEHMVLGIDCSCGNQLPLVFRKMRKIGEREKWERGRLLAVPIARKSARARARALSLCVDCEGRFDPSKLCWFLSIYWWELMGGLPPSFPAGLCVSPRPRHAAAPHFTTTRGKEHVLTHAHAVAGKVPGLRAWGYLRKFGGSQGMHSARLSWTLWMPCSLLVAFQVVVPVFRSTPHLLAQDKRNSAAASDWAQRRREQQERAAQLRAERTAAAAGASGGADRGRGGAAHRRTVAFLTHVGTA